MGPAPDPGISPDAGSPYRRTVTASPAEAAATSAGAGAGEPDRSGGPGAPVLRIRQGPSAGAVFAVPPGTTRLGRGRDCDIMLEHPTVSRHHALLQRLGDRVVLRDADSLNGTYHNDRRLDADAAPLATGDEIGLGVFRLTFHDQD